MNQFNAFRKVLGMGLIASLLWLNLNVGYMIIHILDRWTIYRRLLFTAILENVTVDGADQDVLTGDLTAQPDSNIDLATTEAHVNEYWPYGDEEKYA